MEMFIEAFMLFLCFSTSFCIEESFCAGTGYNNLNQEMLGLRSVGYHYVYGHPLTTIWAANHVTASTTRDDGVTFQLNLVEQKLPNGNTAQLHGWLNIQVKKDRGYFKALALWALTDTRESIGEFFNMTGLTGCTCWKRASEILPCSAAPIDTSRNPNMFVYANSDRRNENENVITIFWKMSTSYCNKPKKFRFFAATSSKTWTQWTPPFNVKDGDTNDLGPLIYTTPWLEPKFYGPAGQVVDKSTLQCKSRIEITQAVWLKGKPTLPMTLQVEPDWMKQRWTSNGMEDIQVVKNIATCKAQEDGLVYHGGRCTGKVNNAARVFATLNTLPICDHVPSNFDAEDLKLFKGSLTDKLQETEKQLLKNCECPRVPTATEVMGLVTSLRSRNVPTLRKRQITEFENYENKDDDFVTDAGVEVADNDNNHDTSTTNFSYTDTPESTSSQTSISNEPVLLTPRKMQNVVTSGTGTSTTLSNNMTAVTSTDKYGQGSNLSSTTYEPVIDNSRLIDEEHLRNQKDNVHITCALQHKNFSNYNKLGLCLDSAAGRIVYGVRQWHAVSTLLCTIVLIPVASYLARYHKGSLPVKVSGVPYMPVRVWYIVHILIILPILCLYTTGMVSIRRQRSVLGYSLSGYAKFHRVTGMILIGLVILQIFTGFLRPQNVSFRKIAIWAHFIIGLLINYGGLLMCIMTYRIPGSPTAFQPHVFPHLFNPIGKHIAPMILAFWIIVDLAYQAYLTVHVIQFDKSVGVQRSYFPVMIPSIADKRIQFDDEYEKEHSFQKGTFAAYIIFSIFIFFVTCISIYYLNDERGQGFGPMYCTHDSKGHFFDPAEYGKVNGLPGYCN